MGIDRNIFIGAFLECENKIIEKDIYNNKCDYCNIVFDHLAYYCNKCGNELKSFKAIETEKEKQVNIYDVVDIIDEVLICNNFNIENSDKDIWYSNLSSKKCHFYINENLCIKDINIALIQSSLDEFKKTFKDEIEIITKAYNGNVKLKFGVVQYYS